MYNSVRKWFRAGALASLVSSPLLLADDTEIYLGVGADEQAKPMVMLTLDLRPNLGSTVCSDVTSKSCLDTLAPGGDMRLYQGIDLLTITDGTVDDSKGADGYPDYPDYALGDTPPEAWKGMNATLFDILRAAFQVVLTEPVILSGKMKLGMMVTHDDNNQCGKFKGPEAIPDPNNPAAPTLGCSNGAYVLKGFFNPSAIDPNTKEPGPSKDLEDLFKRLAAIPDPSRGTYSNPYQLKEMYFEFYRYILGGDMYSGWLGYEDYESDDRTTLYKGNELLAPDPNTYEGSSPDLNYISPFETAGDWACSALYMVNTASGEYESGRDADADAAMEDELGLGSKPVAVDIISALADTDLASSTLGSEVVGDQFVKSYFIVDGPTRTENEWAQAGKTDVALDLGEPGTLIDQLSKLLGGIISESSSLVSASVPANVYNRAETLDNLFLAIFQAEEGPRWPGNLKKLKIVAAPEYEKDANGEYITDASGNRVVVSVRTEIQDVNGKRAFSSEDGRIEHSALTYWTDAAGTDVTPADCSDGELPLEEEEFCGKDGRSVERGGAGQQIPGFITDASCSGPGQLNSNACARKLFTENPTSANTLIPFNYDDSTADALKSYLDREAGDADEAKQVIGWARGLFDRAVDGTVSSDTQRWMMGDAIHSKPLAINFGDTDGGSGYDRDNPNIHLFFGTNDGWFRSVKNTNSGGTQSGEEAWAFMPLEVMHKQQVLSRDSRTRSEDFHPYGVDGQPVALVIDNDSDGNVEIGGTDNDKVYVYFGLRRGGKAYYAMDVSNPTGTPSMLWKITNADPDFSELGLTFSTPQVAKVNHDGTQKNVLIFTAGYNGGWDANGAIRIGKDKLAEFSNATEDSAASGGAVGTAVYVVDAVSGKLLWKATNGSSTGLSQAASDSTPGVFTHADMDYSMPSDITVVDTNQNGVADRAYVGDVGGNVWRIDLPEYGGSSDSRDTWQVSRLAALGADSSPDIVRFFHAPDVILARDKHNVGTTGNPLLVSRDYIGVAIGSGNRAYPKSDMDNVNYLYYLKDPISRYDATALANWTPIEEPGNPSDVSSGGLLDITDCASGDESACGFNNDLSKIANLKNGWALELEEDGEKSLSKPITVQGTTYFTTYLPEGTNIQESCAPALGTGRIYAVSLGDGTPALELDDSIEATDKTQRFTDLDVPGIPPEPPFITTSGIDCPDCDSPLPPGISTAPGALVLPGGDILNINGRFIWKSYWREEGVDK
jgi:type IV pilus assembly protein PilY1